MTEARTERLKEIQQRYIYIYIHVWVCVDLVTLKYFQQFVSDR